VDEMVLKDNRSEGSLDLVEHIGHDRNRLLARAMFFPAKGWKLETYNLSIFPKRDTDWFEIKEEAEEFLVQLGGGSNLVKRRKFTRYSRFSFRNR